MCYRLGKLACVRSEVLLPVYGFRIAELTLCRPQDKTRSAFLHTVTMLFF